MNIFISWSGERSKAVAECLRSWIQDVIHAAHPWISTEDIDPGIRWNSEVAGELEASQFGIICLTRENLAAPWVLFESGALAKTLQNTLVCPYLIDLEVGELTGPLAQFQAAKADKSGTLSLLRSINMRLGEQMVAEDRLRRVFERWWPDLESVLAGLPPPPRTESVDLSGVNKGLESVFLSRGAALDAFMTAFKSELDKADAGEPARLWMVSSSMRGFMVTASDHFDGHKIIERAATSSVDFRVLMTDPEVADFRAQQEGRPRGDIETEIRAGIVRLRNSGIKRECVKYYPGTPTVFAIATSEKMLLNPYPYESESQRCFSLIVQRTKNPEDIYQQYIEYHFERPWRRATAIPLVDWNRGDDLQ